MEMPATVRYFLLGQCEPCIVTLVLFVLTVALPKCKDI